MKLWIDDIRMPPDNDWEWAKTAHDAVRLLRLHWNEINEVSFDHDLGENSRTGYDILIWIERRCARGKKFPALMFTHSANPVGRANMQAAIQSINRIIRAQS